MYFNVSKSGLFQLSHNFCVPSHQILGKNQLIRMYITIRYMKQQISKRFNNLANQGRTPPGHMAQRLKGQPCVAGFPTNQVPTNQGSCPLRRTSWRARKSCMRLSTSLRFGVPARVQRVRIGACSELPKKNLNFDQVYLLWKNPIEQEVAHCKKAPLLYNFSNIIKILFLRFQSR